ncbi:ATPase AAA [Acrocarpospora phusangensis]|uniref:ATPase AAA n=1 Tax=Acrocarpospora phusangensis TaxID=1070424 RepID=A0A919UNE6_9ACTN|nr:BTAD domain-containing putative transcriptional regulator [Acrocarpospora phusangensis]GIH24243.1 ATPase AAA [Acrocarpospora phusangensis]
MQAMFRVLGPFTVSVNGDPSDVGGPRPRLLLARLLIARGATVSVDALLDDLYDGEPPARALGTLHSYISNLRRLLEPGRAPRTPSTLLINRPPGYALGPHWLDADEFDRLSGQGRYDAALELWRGTPYEEFADVPWLRPEIERLEQARLAVREQRLASMEPSPGMLAELTALAHANPLRESLWQALARALYRLGRQADALDALRAARRHLAEELGLDPGPGIQRLEAMILEQDPALGGAVLVAAAEPRPAARLTVGRAAQLDRLTEVAADVSAGVTRMVVVSGEPGIGKTWLAGEFARGREAAGWQVAWGHCHEMSGAPPLWPWRQIARELAARTPPGPAEADALRPLTDDHDDQGDRIGRDHREDPDERVGEHPGAGLREGVGVREGVGLRDGVGRREDGEARFRLHRAVAAYLAAVSAARPLLLVLDDLQWADAASLGLLADLAKLQRGRVAVVITVRSGEGPPAMYDALGMVGRSQALRLPLAGLDAASVAELSGLDPERATALAERTGGNPLFIRETLRLAEDQGLARALGTVPEGLADVLRQRIRRLPEAYRAVLEAAAVAGGAADPLLLAETLAEDGTRLVAEAVAAAQATRLLGDDHEFTHDLIRETCYADLPPGRRAELHLAVLRGLERRPAADLMAMAAHALAAGPSGAAQAVDLCAAAARQAANRYAHDDAVLWWRRAADTHGRLPGADPARHVELLLGLVRAQLDAGDGFGARATRNEAVLAADRTGGDALAASALTSLDAPGLWKFYTYGDREVQAVERIESVLGRLPEGDSELRCRLLGCLGMELYDGSADPRGDTATAEALAIARRLVAAGADRRLLAVTLNARYLGVQLAERIPELDAIGDELAALGLPGFELLGLLIQERTRLELYDARGADQAAHQAGRLVERLDLPWPRFQHLIYSGARRLVEGDRAGAEERYTAAAEAGERLNLWHTEASLAAALIATNLHHGEPVLDDELIARFSPFPAHRQVIQAVSASFTGDRETLAAIRREGWQPVPRDFTELPTLCLGALARQATGDVAGTRDMYRRLLPYEDRLAIGAGTFPAGPVGYFLGLVAEDAEARRAHFDAAAARCERAGLTWWAERITSVR